MSFLVNWKLYMGSYTHICLYIWVCISSIQSLSCVQPFATPSLQHARLPCPSPTPGTCSNSCLSSLWCHPTISSSVVPFSSCFNLSQHQGLFHWVSTSHQVAKVGVSALAPVLPMNTQDWSPFGWTGWISLQSKGLSRVFSNTIVQKHQFSSTQFSLQSNSHPYMAIGKTIALTRWTFVAKVMSLLFSMLSSLVIAFLPRSKRLLISWLQSPSAVILKPPKIKSLTASIVSPSICHEVMGPDAMILVFWMLNGFSDLSFLSWMSFWS